MSRSIGESTKFFKYRSNIFAFKNTVQLQLLDSAIIAELKIHCRRRQTSITLDRSKKSRSINQIDDLTAMKWMKEVRKI